MTTSLYQQQPTGRLGVLVNSLAGGGAEKVALTLFEEYRRQNRDVMLLCLEKNDFHYTDERDIHYLSEYNGARESGMTKLLSLLVFAVKLKKIIKDQRITCLQSHMYRSNFVNLLARKLGSVHQVQIGNHGIPNRYLREGFLGKINLSLIRWLYPAADLLVCPAAGMLSDFRALRVPVGRAQVIGNPFDVMGIADKSREPVTATEFEFSNRQRYLVAVGRLEKVKGHKHILRALHQLQAEHPELELLLLGAGVEQPGLEMLAEQLGIRSKVHFLGRVSNPYKYVARSDILVSASEYEGFSNVIVEALVAGTAVVSSDCECGPREILAPASKVPHRLAEGGLEFAEYGALFAAGDSEALAAAVSELLKNNNRRSEYECKGIERARAFAKATVARRYLESCD